MEEKLNAHKWTDEETKKLIKARIELDPDFTGKRNTAKKAWINVIHRIDLDGVVTPTQISKKWDNLKRKYKELRCPPTGTGRDGGEITAVTWPWFALMREAIGGRPSVTPPIVIDSCDDVATTSEMVKGTGLPPPGSVEDREEEGSQDDRSNLQEEEPSTSAGPSAPKKSRPNKFLAFLEKESEKEEKRFHATHELMERTSTRFLDLFEELIKKS